MKKNVLNKNERIALSMVLCMPEEQAMLVADEFGMAGAVLVMFFNAYFIVNRINVGFYKHLKDIAFKCYGKGGIAMLKKMVRKNVYKLINSRFIYSGCQNRFFMDDENPQMSEILRLENINLETFSSYSFRMTSKNEQKLARIISGVNKDLPDYIRDNGKYCKSSEDIYKIVLFCIRYSKHNIAAATDINIIARCLGKSWNDLVGLLRDDGIIAFASDGSHIYDANMRKANNLSSLPSDNELLEVRKNYDLRHISFNLITNNYEKRI